MVHFTSASCRGERCSVCADPATHKLGEEIPHDDPQPNRHNLTAYVCCRHFKMLLGPAAGCKTEYHQHPNSHFATGEQDGRK